MFIRTMPRAAAAIAFGVLAACVASCGGGGGDVETSTTVAGLSISDVVFEPLKAEVLADDAAVVLAVSFRVSGDRSVLDSRGIYLRLIDASGSFALNDSQIDAQTGSVQARLEALPSALKLGLNEGQVRLVACVDSHCTQTIGASPIAVPYSVQVRHALSIDVADPANGISLEAAFGSAADQAPIAITVPEGTTSVVVGPGGLMRRQSAVVINTGAHDDTAVTARVVFAPGPQVILSGQLRQVGTYYTELSLTASYTTTSGEQRTTTKVFPVGYVVHADPQRPYLTDSSSLSFALSPDAYSRSSLVTILTPGAGPETANGASHWPGIGAVTVEYLPPDGSGNLDAGDQHWVELHNDGIVQGRTGYETRVVATRCNVAAGNDMLCLAPGRYEAIVHVGSPQPDGTSVDMPLPVSLTVTP